jgi:hypothetical protein
MAKTKEKRKTLLELVDDESVKDVLRQPVGSPVRLTREQALAVVRAGIGGCPDLPPGDEYVRKVSKIWRGYLPRG